MLKAAQIPENVQAMAQNGLAKTQELCANTVASAQDGARVMTEIADTAWSSAKLLNAKIGENLSANFEAGFAAANKIAKAQSLPEMAKLQSEYWQTMAARATEQAKEFVDLSMRTTKDICEKVQVISPQSMNKKL